MKVHKTQLQRIKEKLERDGFVTRNECLRQFPAITRLGARICDLEDVGYVFETENTGRDYVYRLVSVKGVRSDKSAQTREDHLRIAREAVEAFDNYQSTQTV